MSDENKTTPPEEMELESTCDSRNLIPPVGWQAPLFDLLGILARKRFFIVLAALAGGSLGYMKFKQAKPFYRASTIAILLPREKPIVDAMVVTGSTKTAEESANRSEAASLMLPPQIELYIALLTSRPVLEQIGTRFEERLLESDNMKDNDRSDEIVTRVHDMLKIEGTDDGLLTITVTAFEPQLAADVANAMIEFGMEASKDIERQLLIQQAGFLDEAVAKMQLQLDEDERALQVFQEEHSIVDPGMQADGRYRSIREILATVQKTEQMLAQRLVHHTEKDGTVKQLRAQIETGWATIERMTADFAGSTSEAEYGRLYIEYEKLKQRVVSRRDVLITLAAQTDIFRIRAEQPAGNMAVVTEALPAARPAGPSKTMSVGLLFGAFLFVSIGATLVLDQLKVAREDPLIESKVREVRRTLLGPPRVGFVFKPLKKLLRKKAA